MGRCRKFGSVILGIWIHSAHGFSSNDSLIGRLAGYVCENKATPPWQSLINMGFTGARAKVHVYSIDESQKLKGVFAPKQAERMGLGRDFANKIVGQCPNGQKWVLVSSGPADAFQFKPNQIEFDVGKLKSNCSLNSGRFLKYSGGRSRYIKLPAEIKSKLTINTRFLEPGIMFVTCRYLGDPAKRIRPMFHIPIGGQDQQLPNDDLLTQQDATAKLLARWINQVRTNEGLNPLVLVDNDAAIEQGREKLLPFQRVINKDPGLKLEGNWHMNGTIVSYGRDPKEVAWGIWNSPEYRDKILEKDLTSLMIASHSLDGQLFAYVYALNSVARR